MKYKYPEFRILLFAREPVYGEVKTRLHSAIGEARAYELHCAMLRYQVDKVINSGLAPLELWVSGNPANPVLVDLSLQSPIFRQQGSDLGQRMKAAVVAARSRSDGVILLGTDCPSVDSDYLESALGLLSAGTQLIIGPAEDGGYVLLGVRECWPALFDDIAWGTSQVLSATLQKASRLGLDFKMLPKRWDVDRPEDLRRLATLDPALDFELEFRT